MIRTGSEQISSADKDAKSTYLFAVLSKTSPFETYFASLRSLMPRKMAHLFGSTTFMDGKVSMRFALNFHCSSHLPLEDML